MQSPPTAADLLEPTGDAEAPPIAPPAGKWGSWVSNLNAKMEHVLSNSEMPSPLSTFADSLIATADRFILGSAAMAEIEERVAAAQEEAAQAAAISAALQMGSTTDDAPTLPSARLAIGTVRGRLLLWRADEAAPDTTLTSAADEQAPITALTVLPASRVLLSGNAEGTVQVWLLAADSGSAARGRSLGAPAAHFGLVAALVGTPAGPDAPARLISCGGTDGTVKLWDVESGACCIAPARHDGGAHAAACLTDNTFVTGGADACLRFWAFTPGAVGEACGVTLLGTARARNPIACLCGLPDGRCASGDATPREGGGFEAVTLWSSAFEPERTVTLPGAATSLALLTADADPVPRLAVGCADAHVCIIFAEPRPVLAPEAVQPAAPPVLLMKGHASRVVSLAVVQGAATPVIFSVGGNGTGVVWSQPPQGGVLTRRRVLATPPGAGGISALVTLPAK
jgi:hypothetical protein